MDWVGVSLSGKGDARRLAVTIATFRSYMELDAIAPVGGKRRGGARRKQAGEYNKRGQRAAK